VKLKNNENYLRSNFQNDFGPKFSLCFIELQEIFGNKFHDDTSMQDSIENSLKTAI